MHKFCMFQIKSFGKVSGKQCRPHWSLCLSILAHIYPKLTNVELLAKAKLLCEKWRMHLNRLKRSPDCAITFELFARLARCEILVFDAKRTSKERRLRAHYFPPLSKRPRPLCYLRVMGRNNIYSLLQPITDPGYHKCKRCRERVSNKTRDRARHGAFCAKFLPRQQHLGDPT